MIKTRYFLLLFVLLGFPFASEAQNRSIFIEGSSGNAQHLTFFMQNFRTEGAGSGYPITEDRVEAGYIFGFNVTPNVITYDDGTQGPPEPDDPQFNIQITLTDNSTNEQIVSFGFPYRALDDMYEYTQFLFLRAAINIPNGVEEVIVEEEIDDSWQNQWLYLRFSVDYPITFYRLLGKGLVNDGTSVYIGSYENPDDFTSTDNRTLALPGATVGLQVQFLDWLSLEPFFQAVYNHEVRNFTADVGARLMFPIKSVRNVLIEPYAAFSYPLFYNDEDFSDYPSFAVGAGLQVGIRGGRNGVLFIDLNYLYSFGDAVLINPYGVKYPNPEGIHFQRSVLGLGIGYKFGFIDRQRD